MDKSSTYPVSKCRFRDQTTNTKHSITTVNLDCLQRDTHHQAPKKPCLDPAQQHDKRHKPRFPCNGKLKISFNDNSQHLHILLSHDVSHVAYRTPRIPANWKQYICEHKEWTPSKVTTSIPLNTGWPLFRSGRVFWRRAKQREQLDSTSRVCITIGCSSLAMNGNMLTILLSLHTSISEQTSLRKTSSSWNLMMSLAHRSSRSWSPISWTTSRGGPSHF